jgi:hypothetical protein
VPPFLIWKGFFNMEKILMESTTWPDEKIRIFVFSMFSRGAQHEVYHIIEQLEKECSRCVKLIAEAGPITENNQQNFFEIKHYTDDPMYLLGRNKDFFEALKK